MKLHLSFILYYYNGPILHPFHPQCVLFDGLNNAVNIGKMMISGLNFGADEGDETE